MWTRLIRFVAENGKTYTGDALVSGDARLAEKARTILGDPFGEYQFGETLAIKRLLPPLSTNQVRTVRCLGLNYRKHAAEANMTEPKYPIVFNKPATAVSGPLEPIPVPIMAQAEGTVDYEAELVVVIGKTARGVSQEDALSYVAGYAVGNDVSQREWQLKRGGGQWNVSKMFDGSAPIGPAIVAPHALPSPSDLHIWSKVNGESRQSESTGDMIYGVAEIISWLSQGSTLQPGDIFFMGTPAGVGMGFKPPKWLRGGDVIECGIDGIGSIVNKVDWESGAKL